VWVWVWVRMCRVECRCVGGGSSLTLKEESVGDVRVLAILIGLK